MRAFLAFAAVGTAGLVVDGAVFSALAWLGAPAGVARLVSIAVAMTFNYALNRRLTFRMAEPASLAEFGRYVLVNAAGAVINWLVFMALLWLWPSLWQLIAVAAGAVAGLGFNFIFSHRFAFSGQRLP